MIRLLLVDRTRLVCEMVGAALQEEPDIQVMGIATDPDSALTQIEKSECNLVIVSASLGNCVALKLMKTIRKERPKVRMLVMGLADVESVIMRYIEAGACGYVLVGDGISEFLHSVRAMFEDKALVSPTIAARLMARVAELTERLAGVGINPNNFERLTSREKEILDLISDGLNNQEIADRLIIEVGTVKNHVHHILEKLNVNSRMDAVLYASLSEHNGALTPDVHGMFRWQRESAFILDGSGDHRSKPTQDNAAYRLPA